jgi:hypothetical protein
MDDGLREGSRIICITFRPLALKLRGQTSEQDHLKAYGG